MPKLTDHEFLTTLSVLNNALGIVGFSAGTSRTVRAEIERVYNLGYTVGYTDAENRFKPKEPEAPLVKSLADLLGAFEGGGARVVRLPHSDDPVYITGVVRFSSNPNRYEVRYRYAADGRFETHEFVF